MKLTCDQIRILAQGAAEVYQEHDHICLSRLTSAQEALFQGRSDFLYTRARASAGIRLDFRTDSTSLSLTVQTYGGSASRFFCHEIFVNGTPIGVLENRDTAEGVYSGTYSLGEGEKDVCVYFPWSVRSELIALELDDGSQISPRPRKRKMLIFGDSITQGAIAFRPSRSYASRLADALDAEAFNKAIAGDVFYAPYAEFAEDRAFDYITVAYGTNDWKKTTRDSFLKNCAQFYQTISQKYPHTKIFAITPIWRADSDQSTDVGSFSFVSESIASTVAPLKNVTLIRGIDFVPKDCKYFSDLRLHPNDEGFDLYADALIREIQQYL